ncbi:rCG20472 [Rattus norvegicus]|uniref:RCG20472 n=1 Tax=Rattus norvegicus TaxID=10116 RepID=A6JGG3_RAT|nr:rCG20472 [Rattus norvegicus]
MVMCRGKELVKRQILVANPTHLHQNVCRLCCPETTPNKCSSHLYSEKYFFPLNINEC